jgi:predicted SAM-dependent methyltransferase
MLKIDLGGSKNAETVGGTWKIMDIFEGADFVYDITSGESFSLQDNSVSAFYSSHTFEHADYEKVDFLLQEMYRTLIPGGKIRIVVPDYDVAIYCYINKIPFPSNFPSGGDNNHQITRLHAFGSTPDKFRDHDQKIKSYNQLGGNYISQNNVNFVGAGHKSIFNFEYLDSKMKEFKFKNITRKSWNQCDSEFKEKEKGYYQRYSNFSIYVEATK